MNEGNTRSLLSRGLASLQNVSTVTVLFGCVLLISIWAGLFYKINAERQMEVESAFRETANLARAIEEHTLRTIQGVDQTVLFIKFQYEKEGTQIDIPQYIREGRIDGQPLVHLSVIDENGDLAVSSHTPFVPSNLKDREHFLVHKDHDRRELFISKPVLGRSSGKWFIQLTRRINKTDGSFGGVVVASVDPYYFTEFYRQVNIGDNASVALIGRDGVIRARETGRISEIGDDVSRSVLSQNVVYGGIGQFNAISPFDGVKRLYSYRTLSAYPVVVVVGFGEQEILSDFNQRVVDYYWGAGAVTIVIVAFIVTLLLMVARQKRTEEELRQARDGLEVTVEKRTQQLFAANRELVATNENLTAALSTIELTQARMLRQEKMAGIGQLAAGVAHEINNPLAFVSVNHETLKKYLDAFCQVLSRYRELKAELTAADKPPPQEKLAEIARIEKELALDYILKDFPDLLSDTTEGLDRMSKIVKGMRMFSHVDRQAAIEYYDLLDGLENTLLVVNNEFKHHAVLEKDLRPLPLIEAVGGEINQVILNLIVNAAHAVKEKDAGEMGLIRLATWADDESVYFSVTDSGTGIAPEHLTSIFNPFFTTKPVGKGTGMGLSISYDIVVNRHHGDIEAQNIEGGGAKFTVRLPIKHKPGGEEN